MTRLYQKPIIHARDHMPGGADPIPGLLVSGSYQEQILAEPSLVGYWPLDDASEPALDHSSSGRDLTEPDLSPTYLQTGPFPDDPAATSVFFNHTSGFTASGDYLADVNAGGSYQFAGTDPYTFEILFYPTAAPATVEDGIMTVWEFAGGSTGGLSLTFRPTGEIRMRRASLTFDSVTTLTLNEWVHLAMTYDGATLRLYFDGAEQVASATATSHGNSGLLRLGVIRDITGSSWNGNLHGRLAQAAIYNEALDAATVALHAQGFQGGGGGGGGVYPGHYPIVNADVDSAADIAPTKLAHPGGTSSFLRADGTWATPAGGSGAVATDVIWDTKGDLAAASGSNAASKLPAGSNDQVLVADSSQTLGLKWAAVPGTSAFVPVATIDAKGDLLVGTANDALDNLTVGSNNQVLTADSAQTMGVKWATPATGAVATDAIWDTKGDLAVASAADAASKLPVGTNNHVLTADSAQTLGVKWAAAPGGAVVSDTIWDTKGDVAVASAADTAAVLPVGSNSQVLTADSAQTLGVKWATPAAGGSPKLYDSTVAGSDATSIDTGASGVAGGYIAIEILIFMRCDGASGTEQVYIRFNNDTGTNYDWQGVQGVASTASATSTANDNGIQIQALGGATTATTFAVFRILILMYADATVRKTATWTGGHEDVTTGRLAQTGVGTWKSTAAISRFAILPVSGTRKLKVGSRVVIFGIG